MDSISTRPGPIETPRPGASRPSPAADPQPDAAAADRFTGSTPQPEIPGLKDLRAAVAGAGTDRSQREALVQGMLRRGGHPIDPAVAQQVQDELSVIPLDVLQAIDRNQTRMVVLKDGESPRDVGAIAPVDPKQDFDAAKLRATTDAAFQSADEKYGAQIGELEQKLAAERKAAAERQQKNPPGVGFGMLDTQQGRDMTDLDPQVQKVGVELYRARAQRDGAAYGEIYQKTGRRVEPFSVPGTDQLPGNFNAMAASMPATMEMIARLHGARTPEEIAEFSTLMKQVNGDRLTRAQRRFADGYEKSPMGQSGKKPPWEGNPDAIAFIPGPDRIVVPSLYYHRRNPGDAGEKALPVDGHDFNSLLGWSSGNTLGQYWYQGDKNTLVLHEKRLGKGPHGHVTSVHEMGHAYEDAVSQLAPQEFAAFEKTRNETFHRFRAGQPSHFVTDYAARSPAELTAESFAEKYGGDARKLHDADPEWARTFDRFTDQARRLAPGGSTR